MRWKGPPRRPDAVTVKPISTFLPKWQAIRESIEPGQRLLVVGAGAGGVELVLAARAVLPADCGITLVGEVLMPGHNARAGTKVARRLARADIEWIAGRVEQESPAGVELQNGSVVNADHVLWVTQVQAPEWLGHSGLQVDERGFVMVDHYLRSLSHPDVFAAGDIAHLHGQQRAKSGVYAVRAGPYLTENLRRAVNERPLRRYRARTDE